MYKGKHLKHEKPSRWHKSKAMLVSLLLVIGVTIGGTLAYIVTDSGPVKNTFTPSKVTTYVEETVSGSTKSNVMIKNTGDTTAYIRAAVVITWQDVAGNVYGQKPDEDDYTIIWGSNKWELGDDGFYYYLDEVAAEDETENLIAKCEPKSGTAPEGYSLAVEIICSGIQAEGQDNKGNKPVELAWGVDIDGGELKAVTIER